MNENSEFLIMEMDTFAKKMIARDVCFLVQGVQDLFLEPPYEEETDKRFLQ